MFPPPAFLLAATVLALIPGPGIAYVAARTVAGGRADGIASSLGAAVGGMAHVLAAALGLSLLITRSALAFALLQYLGAAYLVYLGVRTLLARPADPAAPVPGRAGVRKAWRDGIVVEMLNVKTAMFILAFIPQFISPAHAVAPQFILLGSLCVLLNTSVDLVVVFAASRLVASGTAKAARQRLFSRLSGSTLLLLGLLVAVANRGS